MPPKRKITKEMVIDAGFEIAHEEGISACNARTVAKRLNCSTQPIFSCFDSMSELKLEIRKKAMKIYDQYIADIDVKVDEKPHLRVSLCYIQFAMHEPNLFKMIFMDDWSQQARKFNMVSREDEMFDYLENDLGLTEAEAREYFLGLWAEAHGIATMLIFKTLIFNPEDVRMLLERTYDGLYAQIINERSKK